MKPQKVHVYFDFKSPYSFIAMDAYFSLQKKIPIELVWHPISLPLDVMEKNYGQVSKRSSVQLNKVKYLYRDCRRQRPDLMIRPPIRYFDSRLSAAACNFAFENEKGELFIQKCFPKVFSREIEPDNIEHLSKLLESLGLDSSMFKQDQERFFKKTTDEWQEFVNQGGFGIPTAAYENELFWGALQIPFLEKKLSSTES